MIQHGNAGGVQTTDANHELLHHLNTPPAKITKPQWYFSHPKQSGNTLRKEINRAKARDDTPAIPIQTTPRSLQATINSLN